MKYTVNRGFVAGRQPAGTARVARARRQFGVDDLSSDVKEMFLFLLGDLTKKAEIIFSAEPRSVAERTVKFWCEQMLNEVMEREEIVAKFPVAVDRAEMRSVILGFLFKSIEEWVVAADGDSEPTFR